MAVVSPMEQQNGDHSGSVDRGHESRQQLDSSAARAQRIGERNAARAGNAMPLSEGSEEKVTEGSADQRQSEGRRERREEKKKRGSVRCEG